ncbi:hypothetical protein C2S52_005742 [Perilla frutescens var. hirtella]|nr:hypothetical protein C2S52_005742 [Perilla frutescens var. hirtella]
MKVKVVSRKLVKPRTPTPQNLKNYNISFMDELNPTMNVNAILYYQPDHDTNTTNETLTKRLEESLAEILPHFYPFAGRYIKKDHLVDCSDQGAEIVAANVELELRQIIHNPSPKELNDLLPRESGAADEEEDPILSIQINKFNCGGIAIGICISHRIIDASSLGTFISAWTKASRGGDGDGDAVVPSFDGPVFLPGKNFPTPEFGLTRTRENALYNIGCKIFKFDKDAISRLKERAAAALVTTGESRPPSRNAVISGLMISAIAGLERARHGQERDLLVVQAVNMRGRTVPPLPKHSCGNLAALAITECSREEIKNMGFLDFVRVLRRDIGKTVGDCAKLLSEEGHKSLIDTSEYASAKSLGHDVNVVWLTDWTKFPFYEADFGWGKPVWASVVDVFIKNHVTMMTTKEGDGVEAWVQLEEREMDSFQNQIKFLMAG